MYSIFKPKGSTITVKEFKNVMATSGEKLSDDVINELFKELKLDKEESFNYEEFIRTILTRWSIYEIEFIYALILFVIISLWWMIWDFFIKFNPTKRLYPLNLS